MVGFLFVHKNIPHDKHPFLQLFLVFRQKERRLPKSKRLKSVLF